MHWYTSRRPASPSSTDARRLGAVDVSSDVRLGTADVSLAGNSGGSSSPSTAFIISMWRASSARSVSTNAEPARAPRTTHITDASTATPPAEEQSEASHASATRKAFGLALREVRPPTKLTTAARSTRHISAATAEASGNLSYVAASRSPRRRPGISGAHERCTGSHASPSRPSALMIIDSRAGGGFGFTCTGASSCSVLRMRSDTASGMTTSASACAGPQQPKSPPMRLGLGAGLAAASWACEVASDERSTLIFSAGGSSTTFCSGASFGMTAAYDASSAAAARSARTARASARTAASSFAFATWRSSHARAAAASASHARARSAVARAHGEPGT